MMNDRVITSLHTAHRRFNWSPLEFRSAQLPPSNESIRGDVYHAVATGVQHSHHKYCAPLILRF